MDTDSVPLSHAEEPKTAQNLFLLALAGLLAIFRNVFLPHIMAGLAVFLLITYVSYACLIEPLHVPDTVRGILLVACVGIYGAVAFGYSLLTSFVFALYKACVAWSELLEKLFDQVKAKTIARLNNMNDGITKDQAKVAVLGSVREVVAQFKPSSIPAMAKWLVSFGIGCIILAMRSVLVAKIVKFSGKTINIGKLFAGRATLAGAVFLNLRFFSTLLLFVLYVGGVFLITINLFFVWSVR